MRAGLDELVRWMNDQVRQGLSSLSGRYDEWNRQRFTNPLHDAVAWMPNVSWRDDPDVAAAVGRMDQR